MNKRDRLAAEKLFSMGTRSLREDLTEAQEQTNKVREKNARLKALRLAKTALEKP